MNHEDRTAIEGRTLLLFDGLCALCHGTVHFLIRRDPLRKLLYVSLESHLGREMLESVGIYPVSCRNTDGNDVTQMGIVLIEGYLTPAQVITTRSNAVIRVLGMLQGAWPLAGVLLALVPYRLRELAYGWIAQWRYWVFGAYANCPIPSAAERSLILGSGD